MDTTRITIIVSNPTIPHIMKKMFSANGGHFSHANSPLRLYPGAQTEQSLS